MQRFLLYGAKGAFIAVFDELCAADWSVLSYSPAPSFTFQGSYFSFPCRVTHPALDSIRLMVGHVPILEPIKVQ